LQEQNEMLRQMVMQQQGGQGQMQAPREQAGPPEGFGRGPRGSSRGGMRPPEGGPVPMGTNLVASSDTNATIRMNFRNAQLEPVLNYLSEAAGYTIVLETQIRGTVDIWSEHLMTRQEAIQALNAAVSKNGYAIVKEGNLLRVLSSGSRNDVGIPTITVSSTNDVSRTAEIVTAIIPIRYISASEVINNVYPLLPGSAQMTANIGGNSLVLTDTKATVRRIVEVIRALDNPIASGTSFQVIPLNYADAKTVQAVIQGLYQNQGRGGGGQGANPFLQMMQNMGGRGGGGFGGGFGGGGRGGRGG
jgi:type II secretory pathway component GspD/PulD (secretin)